MKKLLILCAFFGLFLSSLAHPVDKESAQALATKFMTTNDVQLITTYQTDKNIAAFYVFNTSDGFVIVTADDCETPIIAYSHEGRLDPNNVPIQMQAYLQDFAERIQYGIDNQIVADETTTRQWELVKATGRLNDSKDTQAVAPLLTEKWHQGCRYNSLCPAISGPCGHAEVGCVAVAMAQIMHYHRYPATGWGTHTNSTNTSLSADFGNTTYDWEHMPDSLTENSSEAEIEAVATLMYHCGISVDMRYTANGSTAKSSDVPNALTRYFDYSRQMHREKKADYDNETWAAMLRADLDLQQPVLYSGASSGNAGHAFVCDGYDANGLFHFNWGWGGPGDGYFALGNLNPIGYEFNNSHYAIFGIVPQYEPCHVSASVYPSNAGTIEGMGEYHLGAQCTLTAIPSENADFRFWKKDGRVVSYYLSYSFNVLDDTNDYEACFTFQPVNQIAAVYAPEANDPTSPYVSLTWNYKDQEWVLLNEFEIYKTDNTFNIQITTDDEHIYLSYPSWINPPSTFEKYSKDGELVEQFDIPGADPDDLTYDGNYFYCSNNMNSFNVFQLYCLDFENKTIIDSTYMQMQFDLCSYDADNDGFWVCLSYYSNRSITLKNRQGETLMSTPTINTSYCSIIDFGSIIAKDGTSHLLIVLSNGELYDYDISNNTLYHHPSLFLLGYNIISTHIGKYDGKDALYVVAAPYDSFNYNIKITIFEINSHLEQIDHYRLYRADSEGHAVMLADGIAGSDFIDSTWNDVENGTYRYGISEIFANGNESEIVWSNTIEKTNFALDENEPDISNSNVQKVFENGQIVIIKEGKRYTVTGQEMK